ncbi:MAG TPA: dihydropteroate synthase [Methylococcaceae bacterium]|nr:dihydropteroate synthase [Methylococcaceae bacterium]
MSRLVERLHGDVPLLMGILNVTPDSFSDGGRHLPLDAALEQAGRMLTEGADILDVGGESTRPGSEPVDAAEQMRRVLPVIEAIRRQWPECCVSVDTSRAAVAEAALDAGADLVNDISAGRDDPKMFPLIAARGVPILLMHMQGTPKTMQDNPCYEDVVEEVLAFFRERIAAARAAGIPDRHIVLDPGIGFGKRKQDNLDLLASLDRFTAMGYPVLLGASRKRFMGAICRETEPAALVPATVATTALGVMAGIRIFRVHDVRENRQAADIAAAVRTARRPHPGPLAEGEGEQGRGQFPI